jgi:hypothetical protein
MHKRFGFLSVMLVVLSACQARSSKPTVTAESSGVQSASSVLSSNLVQFQSSHLTSLPVVNAGASGSSSATALNFQILPASQIQQMIKSQLGTSSYDQIQSAYQSYVAQPTGALPGILGQILFLKVPVGSIVVTMNIKIIDLMSPYAAIITNGVTAFFGHVKMNSLSTNDFVESLFEVTGESYFLRGSSLIVLGGKSSKGANRKISAIQFSMNRFTISNLGSGLPTSYLTSAAELVTSSFQSGISALSADQGKILLAFQDGNHVFSVFKVMDWANYTLSPRSINCLSVTSKFTPNLNCTPFISAEDNGSVNFELNETFK